MNKFIDDGIGLVITMPTMRRYKLDDGKYVWTNSPDAFKGTVFEGKIITQEKE